MAIVDHSLMRTKSELPRFRDLEAVMKVMGHRDVKTAMKYQHPEIDIVRAVLNQGDAATEADA
jgi:hypothetical protein